MHANRNKSALHRVERGMMRANRTRNVFAVFSIILTTFMITTVFTLGINYRENMELMGVRTAGTTADISLSAPSPEQEQTIRSLDYVKHAGVQYPVGQVHATNEEGRALSIALSYYDETEWEEHYLGAISKVNGSYPKSADEIMLSEDALSGLGVKEPSLGMEIPLSYSDKKGEQEKTFSLSGWFHSYTGTGMGFVSKSYCEDAGYTMAQDGVLSLSVKKMPGDYYRIQNDVTLRDDQTLQASIELDSKSGSVLAMGILLVFFIIGSGYLLIYNVLYISISRDTRFYGLMKTLGTTQKQILSIVKNQAVRFACIGIPVGILLATAVSFGIVPFALNRGFEQGRSLMDAKVFFHPSIYILSVLFSAATVWIACHAPAKAAAGTSPVEALKFQNFAPKQAKSRNSTDGGKLHVMAFHNVFRDRKRAILVFSSLFMGITMILGVNGVIGSYKAENYIKEYMDYNFEYTDIQFEQPEQPNKEIPQFDEHFVEQIRQIDGVESVKVQKTVWAAIDFDEEALEDTPIDPDAFRRGETAIAGMDNDWFAQNHALIGETLTLTADSADGHAEDFSIGGAFYYGDYDDTLSKGIQRRTDINVVPDILFVSEAGMERLTNEALISGIGVNITDLRLLERVDHKLQTVNATLPTADWNYKSCVGIAEQFRQMFYSVNLLGNGAAVLLIVIGLINFVNVMLAGVVSRRNEFAIMESIGTTKKQIRRILTLEGGIYALITTVLIMTLGNAFLLLVSKAVPHLANYAEFEYPVVLVVCLIAAIFLICLCVPAIVYRTVSNETVIERLHNFEN